jgi:hypothetical protein
VDDDGFGSVADCNDATPAYLTIGAAVAAASSGDTNSTRSLEGLRSMHTHRRVAAAFRRTWHAWSRSFDTGRGISCEPD